MIFTIHSTDVIEATKIKADQMFFDECGKSWTWKLQNMEQKAAIYYDQLQKGQYEDKDYVFLVHFEDATHEV